MNRIRPWISAYLILALGLAGVAGLVPWLHVWVEHGGEGVPHFHARSAPVWPLPKTEVRPFGTDRSSNFIQSARTFEFENRHSTFQIPLRQLTAWLQTLGRRLAGNGPATPDPTPAPDAPGHHHEGLSQLLGEGLIDVASTDGTPILFAFSGVPLLGSTCHSPRIHTWDPQTAGRAPPGV